MKQETVARGKITSRGEVILRVGMRDLPRTSSDVAGKQKGGGGGSSFSPPEKFAVRLFVACRTFYLHCVAPFCVGGLIRFGVKSILGRDPLSASEKQAPVGKGFKRASGFCSDDP